MNSKNYKFKLIVTVANKLHHVGHTWAGGRIAVRLLWDGARTLLSRLCHGVRGGDSGSVLLSGCSIGGFFFLVL